ncbi:hypothetical protein BD413DRAFT_53678 [Trametes elegans]|nr:hypothetical protein BD413DRAFT_53678 [Trametes elegans]
MFSIVRHCTWVASRRTTVPLLGLRTVLPVWSTYNRTLKRTRQYASSNPHRPPSEQPVLVSLQETIPDVERSLDDLQDFADIELISGELEQTQRVLEDPHLWLTNPAGAAKAQSRLSDLQHQLSTRRKLRSSLDRLKELAALAEKAGDTDLQSSLLLDLRALKRSAEEHLMSLLLSGPWDQNSAFITIQACSHGAGTWVAALAHMYTRWARSKNYAVTAVEETLEDTATIASATLLVEGRYAYGYSQYESGVHQVRSSPEGRTAPGRQDVAHALVRVLPCIDEDDPILDIDLNPAHLEITTYDSAGVAHAGPKGSASAVRVVHTPTGIMASCEREPSQDRNRALALVLLKARLYGLASQKWGPLPADAPVDPNTQSPVRSYIHNPCTVEDLRTQYRVESDAAQRVFEGDLSGFIEASLRTFKKKA